MDAKRDSVIDFEEYVCAVALFRIGSTEEKIKSEPQLIHEENVNTLQNLYSLKKKNSAKPPETRTISDLFHFHF